MDSLGPVGPETDRGAALQALGLIDTSPEQRFDQFTQLARRLLFAPMATLEVPDGDRVLCKSHPGLAEGSFASEASFCDEVVATGGPLVVEDAAGDERFGHHWLVTGPAEVRFYAGVPVRDPSGAAVAALAVMDTVGRALSAFELDALIDLALMIEHELAAPAAEVTDERTGLFTAATFERIGDWLLEFTTRREVSSLVVCAEVDGALLVDEIDASSSAVADAAGLLRASVRGSDVIGRIGDGQVGVLLVNARADSFPIIRERIAGVAAARAGAADGAATLGLAYGIAEHEPGSPETMADLLRRARLELEGRARAAEPAT